jgi:hypothetical protein
VSDCRSCVCKIRFEGIVSKKLDSPYRSGPSKRIKIKNPKAPAATRIIEGLLKPEFNARGATFGWPLKYVK